MEKKDIREMMIVIWIIWIVATSVIFIGQIITSEEVYDSEKGMKVIVHDEGWNDALKVGVVGFFALGFLVLASPSPERQDVLDKKSH